MILGEAVRAFQNGWFVIGHRSSWGRMQTRLSAYFRWPSLGVARCFSSSSSSSAPPELPRLPATITFNSPTRKEDGILMHHFVKRFGGLELNTAYAYNVLAHHHRHTCILAEEPLVDFLRRTRDSGGAEVSGEPIVIPARSSPRHAEEGIMAGFALGYTPQEQPDTLFIWQVGVSPTHRRLGLAKQLVLRILSQYADSGPNSVSSPLRYLEATIAPSNTASRALFSSLAQELDAQLEIDESFLQSSDFVLPSISTSGEAGHEPEALFRIGPFEYPPK